MKKIGLLDGGTGQEIYKRVGKPESELWSVYAMLQHPEVVINVHSDFVQAGCRTLTLNTYAASPTRLERAGLADQLTAIFSQAKWALDQAVNEAQVKIDRAGCLPPLFGSYRATPPRSFDSLVDEYRRLCALQTDMDLLLIETMTNIPEARAACLAAQESGLPYALGVRVETNGRVRSGESVSELVEACLEFAPSGLFLNCSAPEDISHTIDQLTPFNLPFGAYANGFVSIEPLAAGKSVALLAEREECTPEYYSERAQDWTEQGADMIGGCCEVSPEHMRITAETLGARYELVPISQIIGAQI